MRWPWKKRAVSARSVEARRPCEATTSSALGTGASTSGTSPTAAGICSTSPRGGERDELAGDLSHGGAVAASDDPALVRVEADEAVLAALARYDMDPRRAFPDPATASHYERLRRETKN
jgi:hypothetical protein